jgi:hypothetical protein
MQGGENSHVHDEEEGGVGWCRVYWVGDLVVVIRVIRVWGY